MKKMKTRHYIFLTPLLVLMALLMAACSSDSDVATDDTKPLPEGMGRIRITICTPEDNPDLTRAVNATPWENPDHEWERLQTFRILICNASDNKVVKIISGDKDQMTAETGSSYPYKQSADIITEIPAGSYHIFATANYDDGYTVDPESTVNLDRTERFTNGYSETNIPMTGKLTNSNGSLKEVSVSAGSTTDAGTITVWRVMAKMQFYFTNEASEEIQILGVEVEPVNLATDDEDNSKDGPGIYFFSKDNLELKDNLESGTTHESGKYGITLPDGARTDVGIFRYQPATAPVTLDAYSGTGDKPTGTLFFYVNESDATFTMTQNQYSLRFKIKRGGTISELRYGVTTHYGNGSTGQDGFNVIRRNDWIHIPIILTDWHYRIEPLPFVPIGGYPAATVSSDGLTATFSTGGMIALQPFIKKKGDETWRDFGNTDISYGDIVENEGVVDKAASWAASIHWKNINGTDQSGDNYIVKTAFAYDPDSKCIIGELNNDPDILHHNYMTTFTVHLKLKGPEDSEHPGTYVWYDYTFTFNIVLQ